MYFIHITPCLAEHNIANVNRQHIAELHYITFNFNGIIITYRPNFYWQIMVYTCMRIFEL